MTARILAPLILLLALVSPARAVTFVPVCRSGSALVQCIGQLAPASGGAPDLSSVAAGLVLAGPCSGGAASATLRALCAADMPSGIDATKIGGGTVTNLIFSYLDPTSSIQTQLNAKAPAFSNQSANLVYAGPASGAAAAPAFRAIVALDTAGYLAAPSGAGKILYDTGTAYAAAPSGTSSQVLLGGAAPSFGSLPAAALSADLQALQAFGAGTGFAARTATNTWALRTLSSGTGSTVTNGDGVSGNPSVNVTYGTGSSTATQGNDSRLPPTPSGAGKILYDNGSAYVAFSASTSGALLQTNGAGSAPSWTLAPVVSSLSTATLGPSSGNQNNLPTGSGDTFTMNAKAQTLTNKSISGSTNTLSNIGNAALTNSSITLSCTGLSGCGSVALGSTLSPAVSYGTTSNTATQGNDTRLPPTPTAAGKLLYDTGSAYAEGTAGTSGQVLASGGAGAYSWTTPNSASVISGGVATLAISTTLYLQGIQSAGAASARGIAVFQGNRTLQNLWCIAAGGLGTPTITVGTIPVAGGAGSDSAITCTISGGQCHDTTHTASITGPIQVYVKAVQGGTANTDLFCSVEAI